MVARSIFLLGLWIALACAQKLGPIPGETQADPSLHEAIVLAIGAYEHAAPGGKRLPEVVNTQLLGSDSRSSHEIWTVLRGEQEFRYEVTRLRDGRGASGISVRPIRARSHFGD